MKREQSEQNVSRKIPEQVVRISIVFLVVAGGVIFTRAYVIPDSLKESGYQRTSAIEREVSKEIKYAGRVACAECHEEEYSSITSSYHQDLSCEICHGPANRHAQDSDSVKPSAPRGRKFCPVCHAYDPSRPTGFPQINPIIHNPMTPCIECHDPHDPEPPETPRECSACHAEISRTKMVSHHALLECTTCHTVPEGHKEKPREVKPTKPGKRESCGKCHDVGSENLAAPKVEVATHGEKYLCWQCHYPHMPEVK